MSAKNYFNALALSISVLAGPAFAHHHDLGTVRALEESTQELTQAVSHSSLRYLAKAAVFRFRGDVYELNRCVPPEPEPGVDRHHHEIPPGCLRLLDRARASFYRVDYYLSDAIEYPQVYQSYQETREALYAIEQ